MKRARDTFPEFWSNVSEDYKRAIPALSPAIVKAYFWNAEDPEGGEHLWVDEIRYNGKQISGVLVSQPEYVRGISAGDRVSFGIDQLSDWLFVDEDKVRGAYTVQLLRGRMTPEERAKHDGQYPFTFTPPTKAEP